MESEPTNYSERSVPRVEPTDQISSGYVVNYCLLSYGENPSDVQSYLNIMDQVCTYE
jgi:hypothetical protein